MCVLYYGVRIVSRGVNHLMRKCFLFLKDFFNRRGLLYTPYEGLNVASWKIRKLGVFGSINIRENYHLF